MIEYLHNAIRAVAGQPIGVAAVITDDATGLPITGDCSLMLYDKSGSMLAEVTGNYLEDVDMWEFTIPASVTTGLTGRYWYSIQYSSNNLCFREPIYLV